MGSAEMFTSSERTRAKALREFLVKEIYELECTVGGNSETDDGDCEELTLRIHLKHAQRLRNQLTHLENAWLLDPSKNSLEDIYEEYEYERMYHGKLDLVEAIVESRLEKLWQEEIVREDFDKFAEVSASRGQQSEQRRGNASIVNSAPLREMGISSKDRVHKKHNELTEFPNVKVDGKSNNYINNINNSNNNGQRNGQDNEWSFRQKKSSVPLYPMEDNNESTNYNTRMSGKYVDLLFDVDEDYEGTPFNKKNKDFESIQLQKDANHDINEVQLDQMDDGWSPWFQQASLQPQQNGVVLDLSPSHHSDIIPFDGNPKTFPQFWKKFISEIHEKEGLCPANKLQILKHCSIGKLRSFLQNIDDYSKAVRILVEQFGNIEYVVNEVFSKIVTVPKPQNSTDLIRLKEFLATMQRGISLLNMIGLDRLHRTGVTYSALLLRALPDDLVTKYLNEICHKKSDNASRPDQWALQYIVLIRYKRLRSFVEREIKIREKQLKVSCQSTSLAGEQSKDLCSPSDTGSLQLMGNSYNRL